MTAGVPAIEAIGWGYRHAGRTPWALRNLDLTVEPGERVLLAGPSGAGKSTLLAAVAGLLSGEQSGDREGRLRVFGEPPAGDHRHAVGLVFQDPETQLVMARAGDDVAFGLENHAVPTERIWPQVDAALELVGFGYGRDRPTGRLSGGEKQRLVLAGILALGPKLLLLDEPTANLDPDGAELVREAVARIVETTGATLVIVEHRVGDWLHLVDRVVTLEAGGGVVADGSAESVFADRGSELADAGVWVPTVPLPTRPPPHAVAGATGRTANGSGEPLLRGERLSYRYPSGLGGDGDTPAVLDASIELRAGEVVAVTGANGSGKSTLALMLSGLLAPSAGTVEVNGNGVEPTGRRPNRRGRRDRPLHRWPASTLVQHVGTVFQDPEHQFLTGSVRDELSLGPKAAGLPPERVRNRVDELSTRLRLDQVATANPFTLSGGEKRRLSVATALAGAPRVLVLDEPTFGQDRVTWIELLELLADLRDAGHAICCVSHDEDFVASLGARRHPMAVPR